MTAAAWVRCPWCRLNHTVRVDGLCPRCRQPPSAGEPPAATGPAPGAASPPPPALAVSPVPPAAAAPAPRPRSAPPDAKVPWASGAIVVAFQLLWILANLGFAADDVVELSGAARSVVLLGEISLLAAWIPWLVWVLALGRALRAAGGVDVPSLPWIAGSYLLPTAPVTHYLVLARLWRGAARLDRRAAATGAVDVLLPLWWVGGLLAVGLVGATSPLFAELAGFAIPAAFDPAYAATAGARAFVRLLAVACGAGTIAVVGAFHARLRSVEAPALPGPGAATTAAAGE